MKKTMDITDALDKYIFEKGISSEQAFKILNIIEGYGLVTTVKKFAKENNKSPQAVYRYNDVREWMGIKIVVN